MMLGTVKLINWFSLFLLLNGCGVVSDTRVDYKKSTDAVSSLELPPDLMLETEETLTIPQEIPRQQQGQQGTILSDYERYPQSVLIGGAEVLPPIKKVEVKREGTVRWLVLQTTPEVIWSQVKAFWRAQGFELTIDNPTIGILETEWKENRADIPQDIVRKYAGKLLDFMYSASTRDRFRVRLERRDHNTTELYLTHRGLEEVSQGDSFMWQNRPTDSELEAEMLNRFLVFIGIDKGEATALLNVQQNGNVHSTFSEEQVSLTLIEGDFTKAWQRVGLALDHIGFPIEDRNQTQGTYLIRYLDPEAQGGFFARLFGKNENQEYQLLMIPQGQSIQMTVSDKLGQRDTSKTAVRILTLLHKQLQ